MTSDLLPNQTRRLPGCLSGNLAWRDCRTQVLKRDDGLTITLHSATINWSRTLKLANGKIRCNLQEFELLRWIAEENLATPDSIRASDLKVDYQPQRRYRCIFPHPAAACHDLMEISKGMTKNDLQTLGKEATENHIMVLCPAHAPACEDKTHTCVSKEVYELAAYWPIRQAHSTVAEQGMIDITPVAICLNSPQKGQQRCTVFKTLAEMSAGPPREIRPTGLLEHLHGDIKNVLELGNNRWNPEIALHSSWLNGLHRVTQPAVLRCKHRKADIHPTRLYDARERHAKSGLRPSHYMALSYCWDEWPEKSIGALRDKIYEVSERLGVRYFWVDRWCIDQSDPKDKEREIPRMREYYTGASGCVVFTGPSAVPFKCVPKHEGAILSAFQQIRQNTEALRALLSCKWVHRVWTLQEALLSRQVVYAVQDQLIDGDYISELMAYLATFPEEYLHIGEGRKVWIGEYGCYRWDPRIPAVGFPRQFRMRRQSPTTLTITRTVFGGEQQYRELQSMPRGLFMPLEEAIVMTMDRQATKNEDYIYGILGISDGGGKISIEYGIDWKSMIKKLRESDMVTERQLAAPTVNEEPGWSWLPSCGANYGPFKNIERLSAFMSRPPLPKSGQNIAVLGAVFEWRNRVFHEQGFLNIRGQSCFLMSGKIGFPDYPGIIARVGATSCRPIRKERMEGTHVMLCKGVGRETRDTAVMLVSGDMGNRRVTRKDGYVLEIYEWVSGDPKSIHGKEWTLGVK